MLSIELVPRGNDKTEAQSLLESQLSLIRRQYGCVDAINIPDQDKHPLRSWEGCAIARQFGYRAIPHLRARTAFKDGVLNVLEHVERAGIKDLLVVAGDVGPASCADVLSSVDYIELLTKARPGLRVFAALDQYRQSMVGELKYASEKIRAGASGLFSQPFFSIEAMAAWECEFDQGFIAFGISPVLSDRSREYWVKQNKVVFPASFQPTLEWNRSFLRDALQFVEENKAHAYIMPIKADLEQYLGGILDG